MRWKVLDYYKLKGIGIILLYRKFPSIFPLYCPDICCYAKYPLPLQMWEKVQRHAQNQQFPECWPF